MMKTIQRFLRRNQRTVIVAVISVLLGAGIIVGNVINYNTGLELYEAGSEELPREVRMVQEGDPFVHTFPLEDVGSLEDVEIVVRFEEANPQTPFTVTLNGEDVDTGITGVESGGEQTVTPDSSVLQESNELEISAQFTGIAPNAVVEGFSIRGYRFIDRVIFLIINLVGIVILIGPILSMKYREYKERGRLEEQFPEFLRDVVEGARSGMSLPKAIKNTSGSDYGALDAYVNAMRSKLDWGIPFDKVLRQFADDTKSKMIKRATNTIIQSYRSGSNVDEVLDTVGRNIKQVRQLEQERQSQLYGQIVTGYIVFFVFLGVMIGLINYLVPSLSFSGDIPSTTGSLGLFGSSQDFSVTINQYKPIFRNLIVIQAVFSGLVVGLLSEGELRAGGKHVAILLLVGYSVAALFI